MSVDAKMYIRVDAPSSADGGRYALITSRPGGFMGQSSQVVFFVDGIAHLGTGESAAIVGYTDNPITKEKDVVAEFNALQPYLLLSRNRLDLMSTVEALTFQYNLDKLARATDKELRGTDPDPSEPSGGDVYHAPTGYL